MKDGPLDAAHHDNVVLIGKTRSTGEITTPGLSGLHGPSAGDLLNHPREEVSAMLTKNASDRLRRIERLELGSNVTRAIERESTQARYIRLRDITGRAVDALVVAATSGQD